MVVYVRVHIKSLWDILGLMELNYLFIYLVGLCQWHGDAAFEVVKQTCWYNCHDELSTGNSSV